MVHSKPQYAESVKLLTFSQLKRLEKMDLKKAREEKLIGLGTEATKAVGQIGASGLEAIGAFATGAGGFILGLAAVHLLEKRFQYLIHQDLWTVGFQQLVSSGGSGATAGAAAGGAGFFSPVPVWSAIVYQDVSTGELNAMQSDPTIKILSAKQHTQYEYYLSQDEAELAKSLLTTIAATSGVGTLIRSLKGA